VKLSEQNLLRGAAVLFLALVAFMLFQKSVNEGLNHDEQQFVAPPVLVAKNGAMPYRDFALLHMPNLVFAYAALDKVTTYHFLAARLFNGACAWGIVALVFAGCHRMLVSYKPWPRLGLAAAFAVLFCTSTLAILTNGRTWNHDPALLPVVLAFFTYIVAARGRKAGWWLLACGALVGLAIGTRLTFAPIVAPFGLAVLLLPQPTWQARLKLAAFFSAGVFVALLPAIYFLTAHSEQFLYGNVQSQRLRLLDPSDEWARKTSTLGRKLRFVLKDIILGNDGKGMPGDWPLFFGAIFVAVPGLFLHFRRARRAARPVWSGALLLVLLVPLIFAGVLTPTRFQPQHYYALTPFLVLGTCFGLSQWRARAGWVAAFCAALAMVSLFRARTELAEFVPHQGIGRWVPVRAHRFGEETARHAAGGKVLTLAPIFPLEGGADIYPELAVGPFAYRLAQWLPDEKRPRLKVCAPEDLPALLDKDPPTAVLLGAEDSALETALRQHALLRGFKEVKKFGKMTLLVAP
jgi:hypothetical protein